MLTLKKVFGYLFLLFLLISFIYLGHQYAIAKAPSGIVYNKETELDSMKYGQVVSIDQVNANPDNPDLKEIYFTAILFLDHDRGETVKANHKWFQKRSNGTIHRRQGRFTVIRK